MSLQEFMNKQCLIKSTGELGQIIKVEHRRGKSGLAVWFIVKIDENTHYEARPDQVTISKEL